MHEYMLAILLEQKAEGDEFGRWPLHITLIPWFQIKTSPTELIQAFQRETTMSQSFVVKIGPKKHWGPQAVYLIDNPAVISLHNRLLELVKQYGFLTAPLRFVGAHYKPHITEKSYATVQPGFSVVGKRVYLIEAPKKNPLIRLKKVVAVGELN